MPTIHQHPYTCKAAGRQVTILTWREVVSGIGDECTGIQVEYECRQAGTCPLHAQAACPVHVANRRRQLGGGQAE